MAVLTEAAVLEAANRAESIAKKASPLILREAAETDETSFDVFLSHSYRDAELIVGIHRILAESGLSVYVDWIANGSRDRTNVTEAAADRLRTRMNQCASLFYAHTLKDELMKWMPWEVGYFEARTRRVAILPIARATRQEFHGRDFLGLYPWVDSITDSRGARLVVVNGTPGGLMTVSRWISGGETLASPGV